MAIDTKHEELSALRIDRTEGGEPSPWARRYIVIGIALVVLFGLAVGAYRLFGASAIEVETARATAESSNDGSSATVLSATGYIVAHHKIEANSKVTRRVAWIGVEKGDKVKEGQVLVRLEDQEFRAQYDQALGLEQSAKAQLDQAQHGSRPKEIEQPQHNVGEARRTARDQEHTLHLRKGLLAQ